MLEFHVTEEIFNEVKLGNKTHEYRDFKHYWIKRLENINPPLMANIVKGFTNEKIPITITKISVIPRDRIDVSAYRDYVTTMNCYDIKYKIVNYLDNL